MSGGYVTGVRASPDHCGHIPGKVRWNNIHRLRVYGGCKPVQPTSVFKDNGELTKGSSEVSDRWFQHLKVLNIQSI